MSAPPPKTLIETVTHFVKSLPRLGQPEADSSSNGIPETIRLASRSPSKRSRVLLQLSLPDNQRREVELQDAEIYLGRSERACQIPLAADSISHIHASIRRVAPPLPLPRWIYGILGWDPARYLLKDEESTNGVYRGQRRVKQTLLSHGSQITLGPVRDPQSVRIRVVSPPSWSLYVFRGFWGLCAVITLGAGGWVAQEWGKISVDPEVLQTVVRGPLVVLAGDGQTQLRRTPSDNYRALTGLSDFGDVLPAVVVAAEDHRFYSHWGVDVVGILRASVVNLRSGSVRQGGSSITQQLARTILRDYTGTDNSLGRKLREAVAALKLETRYSKDDLLRVYLNNVYLGNGIYGFESAARFYFGVSAADLDLSQAATLASILPAPNVFNPVDDFNLALQGRDRVLERLSELRRFDDDEIRRARRSRLQLNPELQEATSTLAPYFYNAVLAELTALLGQDLASEGNFVVETTLNMGLQTAAEASLVQAVEQSGSQFGFDQGALVTLDGRTGQVLALVGGTDYRLSSFNRVTQAHRQPGSTFKVFAYAAALESGIPWAQFYECSPLNWGGQTFRGCRGSGGGMDIAQGLILSENVIALRLAQQVGLEQVMATARRMGIQSPLQPYPATVLGAMEVNLLELTGAYGVLADRGIHHRPHTIRRILDSSDCGTPSNWSTCRPIYPARGEDPAQPQVALSPGIAGSLTGVLQRAVQFGTGQAAYLGQGEAGKTGTTDSNKDLWFVGYLPDPAWVTGVWLGNDDATPTQGGSGLAAQVWGNYMRRIRG
ncbi:MAG: FHA domain-containing protein [Synechococcaceae cyanobacterium SM2_3_2]|nr:FHA domain-containing protein [Synechococcaceae cyanobacterium SM2_3_2]